MTERKVVSTEDVRALADAMWYLLDDMGATGTGVCTYAKAKARIAIEPFLKSNPDLIPDYKLEEAQALVEDVDAGR